jgi:phage baseplate assembly protein gpV
MKKTYIIALSFLLILTIGIAINDYAKQYNLIVAEGSTPNPGHPIDQIDGLQSIIDDINNTISGLGVIGEGGSGDVNGDGEIDIVDSLFIASYIEGILETFTPEQKLAADYDGDGVITYYDADAIANVSAGHSKEEAIRMAYSTVGIQDKGSFYKIDHNTNIGGNLDVNGNLNVSGGIRAEGGSGDVEDDGEITSTDSLFILQYLDGTRTFTPEQKLAADYDGDGVITYYDARAILATVVGSSKEEAIRIAHSTVGILNDGSYRILHNTSIGGNLDIDGSLNVSGGIRAEGGSGDVFIDGVINVNDSLYILHYLEGNLEFTPEQKSAADYNGDGVITHYDAIAIFFTIAGYNKEESIRRAQRGVFVPESNESCDNMMEGYMRYNSSAKVMQYCNGSTWTNL